MFILVLTYKKPLEEVDRHLQAHRDFLDRNYAEKILLTSGPRPNRIGGIIVARVKTLAEAQALMKEDPFFRHAIADYEILEFEPTKYLAGFEGFV
ncbi:uncharacterized protein YciI [Dysgonomonas sp. PH5-45]|uniref:YciI family protein n=1 Tax=unclassified Dysgonomonas TaxID=2630389 RepID=UPI002473848A|nr:MULTISPECIES: YciI family protein [unclassified Dysgonomonas]MDH6355047.1 uncharacterized protein YciI [Dysgonomonas sp. PH5-45]MDH6387947.1 uncharacterized protein YciI [Dysgonomonas sp. PH5-37]